MTDRTLHLNLNSIIKVLPFHNLCLPFSVFLLVFLSAVMTLEE